MANRQLTSDELRLANALLDEVRRRLHDLSGGDPELLFAYRRKVSKELTYDERSKPAERRKLKEQKRREQNGLCPICLNPLPPSYCVLDRFSASAGYTRENTRLICQSCDVETQASRKYS
jgi:hypothetical protein